MTTEILFAVAQHAMEFGEPIILSEKTADGRLSKNTQLLLNRLEAKNEQKGQWMD